MKIVNNVRIYSLELNEVELSVIHEGLLGVAYGRSASVFTSINKQLAGQSAPEKENGKDQALPKLPDGADYDRTSMHNGTSGAS
jgi:hypothetical protein